MVEGGKEENIVIKVNEGSTRTCTTVSFGSNNSLKFNNKQKVAQKITGIRASLKVNTSNDKGYDVECNDFKDREYFKDDININVYLSRSFDSIKGKSLKKCKIKIT